MYFILFWEKKEFILFVFFLVYLWPSYPTPLTHACVLVASLLECLDFLYTLNMYVLVILLVSVFSPISMGSPCLSSPYALVVNSFSFVCYLPLLFSPFISFLLSHLTSSIFFFLCCNLSLPITLFSPFHYPSSSLILFVSSSSTTLFLVLLCLLL